MKLMTKALAKKMPALYEHENTPKDEVLVRIHYFTSSWDWYGTEFDEKEGRFFGLVDGHEIELGYFHLSEFEDFNRKHVPGIERDLHWLYKTLEEVTRQRESLRRGLNP